MLTCLPVHVKLLNLSMESHPFPLVSVIIPTLNSARLLAEALQSVSAQTYRPLETLVVDGGSSDDTFQIAQSFPGVRVLRQSGTGMWNALNEGIAQSSGELITFLSYDDLWLSNKLALQVQFMNENPHALLVVVHARFQLIEGEVLPASFKPALLQGNYPANMPEALMARRVVFDLVGRFDETIHLLADVDWFRRVLHQGIAVEVLPQVLLIKRIHAENLSSRTRSALIYRQEMLSVMRQNIHHKKGEAGKK